MYQKVTFTIPEYLATKFRKLVPDGERSEFVTALLSEKLRDFKAKRQAKKDPVKELMAIRRKYKHQLIDEDFDEWKRKMREGLA